MSGQAPTSFVVFTSPRTGSSWLVDLLDSHPRIAAYAELFLPGDRTTPDYGCRDLPRFETTVAPRRRLTLMAARLAYLNRVYAPRNGVEAAGFKLMYGHPEVHRGLLSSLAVRRTWALHLVRENALEQIVSWETSVARKQFRARGDDAVAKVEVPLDVERLVPRLARIEARVGHARRRLRRLRFRTLELTYEGLRDHRQDELDRVARVLGVESCDWSSTLVRMNSRPWRESVANAEDVERALLGTAYAWMLG